MNDRIDLGDWLMSAGPRVLHKAGPEAPSVQKQVCLWDGHGRGGGVLSPQKSVK